MTNGPAVDAKGDADGRGVTETTGVPTNVGNPKMDNREATTSSPSKESSGWGAAGPVAILIDELIKTLRPTAASDKRRRAVFRHVADLVDGCFSGENVLVTAFGSVPLRTYLPDGDIDVCLLGPHSALSKDPCWTTRLRDHIELTEAASEANGEKSEFAVSEMHVVHAEVRLMKCICDGVVVDVSANQFGGLATLGFLEEVDAFISRKITTAAPGLFKRSIVLIKAWGFYEGRLLGAHHALISTYALETLVLYVLNVFWKKHNLSTPLEVLHTFLTVFASFDWDTHAVSIHGPVPLVDLTPKHGDDGRTPGEKTGETRESALLKGKKNALSTEKSPSTAKTVNTSTDPTDEKEPSIQHELLTPEFMWRMLDKYGNESIMRQHAAAGAARGGGVGTAHGVVPDQNLLQNAETKPPNRTRMPIKHLNVIDPLLPSNNLGRSVSLGNASRIRKALTIAAGKLSALREMSARGGSRDRAAVNVLSQFFGNTARHRRVALSLPSAPATPGGREHADEVSMTPAATARRHSVTLLEGEISSTNSSEKTSDGGKRLSAGSASPVSRRPEQSPSSGDLPGRSGCHADVVTGDNGNASPRESSASFGDANAWPRLGNASPTKSSGESEMVPMGIGCPIMHADPVKNGDEDDARGPFWGRWDPLPAAELAAAAAAQALANRHLPRLSNASSVDVVSVGGFPLADDDESLEDPAPGSFRAAAAELAAAALVAHAQTASSGKCPRHARGLSFGNEPEFANNVSAQLADGSTPGSSRGASWRGGGGFAETTSQKAIELGRERAGHDSIPGTSPTERERGCVNDAFVTDEVAGLTFQDSGVTKETSQDSGLSNSKETKETQKTKPNLTIRLGQPPIPPGPPPANLKRLARDAAAARLRREMSCPTFFPETVVSPSYVSGVLGGTGGTGGTNVQQQHLFHALKQQHHFQVDPPLPPPAVQSPKTLGLGDRVDENGPRDIFAGDLAVIWAHLEFGRHYHRSAMLRRYEQYELVSKQRELAAAQTATGNVHHGSSSFGVRDGLGDSNFRGTQGNIAASGGGGDKRGGKRVRGSSEIGESSTVRSRHRRGRGRGLGNDRAAVFPGSGNWNGNGGGHQSAHAYTAAVTAALAAGAEPPKRTGGVGAGGGATNAAARRGEPKRDKKVKEKKKTESESKKIEKAPPLPPGPPPNNTGGGNRTAEGAPGGPEPVPLTTNPLTWGPKRVMAAVKQPLPGSPRKAAETETETRPENGLAADVGASSDLEGFEPGGTADVATVGTSTMNTSQGGSVTIGQTTVTVANSQTPVTVATSPKGSSVALSHKEPATAPSWSCLVKKNPGTFEIGLGSTVSVSGSVSRAASRRASHVDRSPSPVREQMAVSSKNGGTDQSLVTGNGNSDASTRDGNYPGLTSHTEPVWKKPPSSPVRPLAGAWAKGDVKETFAAAAAAAMKAPPPAKEETVTVSSAKQNDAPVTPLAQKSSPSLPSDKSESPSSNDSNAAEKENPPGVGADGKHLKRRESKKSVDEKNAESNFVRKEDDFPGLGGVPVAVVATSVGVWGGAKKGGEGHR